MTLAFPKRLLGLGPGSPGTSWDDALVTAPPSALTGRVASPVLLHGMLEGPTACHIFVEEAALSQNGRDTEVGPEGSRL